MNVIDSLTLKIRDLKSNTIGSGVLYYEAKFKDKVYVLTASHCLFSDGDTFQNIHKELQIGIKKANSNVYEYIQVDVIEKLLFKNAEKDVAVLVLSKKEVERIVGDIPTVSAINKYKDSFQILIKGFPKATNGIELASLSIEWINNSENNRFQLQLNSDYYEDYLKGFSGAGVFLTNGNQIFLLGIVTRYRGEEKGRVIYLNYLNSINELLFQNYLPTISFSYIGSYGLTPHFFQNKVDNSINNLGDRFHKELNFKLQVARLFNDIARDELFIKRFTKIIDHWSQEILRRSNESNEHIGTIEIQLRQIRDEIIDWVKSISFNPVCKIDLDSNILQKINTINDLVEEKKSELYDIQIEEEKNISEKKKKDYSYKRPLESELYRVREIVRTNNNFTYNLEDKISIDLSNKPILILKGDAGEGKSHLLGDIANERIKKNLPTVFLLGGSNFTLAFDLRKNILNALELTCKFEEFLAEINHIGEQIGERVLIMIDALNEGEFQGKWKAELNGFINEILKYPYIALILSIRTTYYYDIIPKEIDQDGSIVKHNHIGFKGNEYKALHFFCEKLGLKQPEFPILSPEFSKPLFLLMICQGVKNSNDKIFPNGFQGVSKIFNYFIDGIKDKEVFKSDVYKLQPDIIKEAIEIFAMACFGKNRGRLKLEDTRTLFKKQFPDTPSLLLDLIRENIFIQDKRADYATGETISNIYYTYERFGDFIIAQKLLENYKTKEEVLVAFHKGNVLGDLITRDYWTFKGLVSAMAIMLPEKYNLEIFEVYNWRYIEEQSSNIGDDSHYLNGYLIDSFKWRSIESIDNEKITKWINSDYFGINDEDYFTCLVELTSVKSHPFNSDRLHTFLKKYTMPERDSFWQQHIRYYSFEDDYKNVYPIRRLIDWAWMPEISDKIDEETARLTGQTLAWLLCSTYRQIRDQATKAMVNLLQNQSDALIKILEAFRDIDDMYILERLYAVAYGCVLRTNNNENIKKVSEYVFDTIFKNGNPPTHILLRDYSRNVIEFAIYRELLNIDTTLIRPPYHSKMPDFFPTDEEIENYKIDYETPNFGKNHEREYNAIYLYVKNNDLYGDKELNDKLRKFASTSFAFEKEYKTFYSTLNKVQKGNIKLYLDYLKLKFVKRINDDSILKPIEKWLDYFSNQFQLMFDDSQLLFINQKVIPHFKCKFNKSYVFQDEPIKNWIIERAHELGYNKDVHGQYDDFVSNGHSSRDDMTINTIGYKYIWIAFYEILAILTDNYHIGGWYEKDTTYKGAWQLWLRDIDPALISRKVTNDLSDEDEVDEFEKSKEWYHNEEYNYWSQANADWVKNINDLPNLKYLIEKSEKSGIDWLQTNLYAEWKEPKPIGEDKYNGTIALKDIWYLVQGLIIKKKDKKRIIEHLKTKSTWGRWLPENSDTHQMFNRETFWSPKVKSQEKENKWSTIRDTNFKVIVPNTDANSHFSSDKSESQLTYEIPCQQIFEGMNLDYSNEDGNTINDKGETISTFLNESLFIRKKDLLDFLNYKNLDIIWYVLAEKRAYSRGWNHRESHYATISGVCYYEKDELKSEIWINQKED
jgi:hypothetical protein